MSAPGRAPVLWVGTALLAGCAQVAPPPGGPLDQTGPAILGVEPESLAVGVPVDAVIRISFSEGVDVKSLERALWVTPGGAAKPRIDVGGEVATIRLGAPFPDSTTMAVLITTVLKDRRREAAENRLERPVRWVFSTGASISPGRIRGTVDRVGITNPEGPVLVALYPDPGDTLPDPAVDEPMAITEADTSGSFELIGLPVDGVRRWLYAMVDRNGNRELGGTGEFASDLPETVLLSVERPEISTRIRLVDPEAPSTLTGSVVKAAPDTVVLGIELLTSGGESPEDTTWTAVQRGQVGKNGKFSLSSVPPGSYRVRVFCDLDGDGRRDPEESEFWIEDVTLEPGSRRDLEEWSIPGCLP